MLNKKNAFTGRTLCIACASFTAGIALCAFFSLSLVVLAVALSAFLFAVAFKKLPYFSLLLIICFGIFIGISHFHLTKLENESFYKQFSGRYLTVSGRITDISYTQDGRQGLVISSDCFTCLNKNYDRKFSAILYTDKEKVFFIGDKITFSDILSPISKNGVHSFNYELYLHTKNISGLFNLGSEYINVNENSKTLSDKIRIFAKDTSNKIRTIIGGEEGEIACAVVMGDKSGFSDNLTKIFSKSGINHIVAVSGMHISILIGFLFLLASKTRLHYKIRNIITILFVIGYMALTGFSPSVVRAGIMAVFMLVSGIVDTEYDHFTALFFSAALILAVNPYAICSASFLLSYLAFMGILLFAPPIKSRITFRFIPNFMRHIFSSSVASFIFTVPVLVLLFGSVSIYSIFTNLLIIPFVSIIFALIIISLICSLIFYPAGIATGFIVKYLIKIMVTVATSISSLPFSYINIRTPTFIDLICYAIIILLFYLMIRGKNSGAIGNNLLAVIVCYFILSFTMSSLTYSVTFFDIGQGDCSLIKTPGNHYYLIDTGPNGDVTMSALKSAGVNRLDIIFISHSDNDHCGGLADILDNIPTKKVVFPEYNTENKEISHLTQLALSTGASVDFANRYYNYNLSGIPVNTIWPSDNGNYVLSENDNSLVLSLNLKGVRFLFTGDIGTVSEELIMSTEEIIDSNVLKVAHHGSNDSTSYQFIEEVSPKYSVISVGKNNTYGHPHEDLLARLDSSGTTVLRTDTMGDIKFNADLFGNMYVSYGG